MASTLALFVSLIVFAAAAVAIYFLNKNFKQMNTTRKVSASFGIIALLVFAMVAFTVSTDQQIPSSLQQPNYL